MINNRKITKGCVYYIALTITILCLQINFAYSQASIDSLHIQLKNALLHGSPADLLPVYAGLTKAHKAGGEYEKAIEFCNRRLGILEDMNASESDLAFEYLKVGSLYQKQGNFENSEIFYRRSLSRIDSIVDAKKYFFAAKGLLEVYRSNQNKEKQYALLLRISSHAERISQSDLIAQASYDLGNFLYLESDYKNALLYFNKSLDYYIRLDNSKGIISLRNCIGSVYANQDRIAESLVSFHKALFEAKVIGDSILISSCYHNIAALSFSSEDYEKANHYIELALNSKLENKSEIISSLYLKGIMYSQLNRLNEAQAFYEKGLELSQRFENAERMKEGYQNLSGLHEQKGELELSLDYSKSYIALSDEAYNKKFTGELEKLKTAHELQKSERENEYLLNQNELVNAKMIWFSLSILGLISALFFGIYLYVVQRKNNALLEQKNHTIKTQNKLLKQSNSDLENFASIASHDLKGPLRTIGGHVSLLQRNYYKEISGEASEFFSFILDAVDHMDELLTDLLDFAKIGNTEPPMEDVDMSHVMDIVSQRLGHQIKAQKADVIVANLPSVKANKILMQQLFQNLMSNAIKFNREDSIAVKVDVMETKDRVVFSVEDNGIGIETEYKERIFKMFQRLHTRQEFEGTGVGLAICQRIVQQHQGKIWLESEYGKGTTFYVELPKSA